MAIRIDHNQRRRRILEASLKLFSEQGYPGVTFQKIADRCGIARTTIYRYFSNKREIFDYAIHQLTARLGLEFRRVMSDPAHSASQKIDIIVTQALEAIFEQRVLLRVVIEYLLNQRRAGQEVSAAMYRHTLGVRLMLQRLFVQGIRAGEFRGLQPRRAADLVYGLLETAVFQVALRDADEPVHVRAALGAMLNGLRAQ